MQNKYLKTKENYNSNNYDLYINSQIPSNIKSSTTEEISEELKELIPLSKRIHLQFKNELINITNLRHVFKSKININIDGVELYPKPQICKVILKNKKLGFRTKLHFDLNNKELKHLSYIEYPINLEDIKLRFRTKSYFDLNGKALNPLVLIDRVVALEKKVNDVVVEVEKSIKEVNQRNLIVDEDLVRGGYVIIAQNEWIKSGTKEHTFHARVLNADGSPAKKKYIDITLFNGTDALKDSYKKFNTDDNGYVSFKMDVSELSKKEASLYNVLWKIKDEKYEFEAVKISYLYVWW